MISEGKERDRDRSDEPRRGDTDRQHPVEVATRATRPGQPAEMSAARQVTKNKGGGRDREGRGTPTDLPGFGVDSLKV